MHTMAFTDVSKLCREMPKAELHAHLNGSITEETLLQLQKKQIGNAGGDGGLKLGFVENVVPSESHIGPRELSECFKLFGKIHDLVTTPEILYSVTKSIIRDFAADNVIYLELRTTPKAVHRIRSKDEYIDSVVRAINDSKDVPIVVKLLLSIDRKTSAADGTENVQLSIKWHLKYPDLVVGVDLSGDPTKGKFEDFAVALQTAKDAGLKITLHLPEVSNEKEALTMIGFRPDRVGHAVHIHPQLGGSYSLWESLKASGIPVEVCLTSNVVTKCSTSYEDHHVKFMLEEKMPFVICTDDSGVFHTTLSGEYAKFANAMKLSPNEIKEICFASVDHLFTHSSEKKEIHDSILSWWQLRYPLSD